MRLVSYLCMNFKVQKLNFLLHASIKINSYNSNHKIRIIKQNPVMLRALRSCGEEKYSGERISHLPTIQKLLEQIEAEECYS